MLQLLPYLSLGLARSALFIAAGVASYYILSRKRLPTLVAWGMIIYGLWLIVGTTVNAFLIYQVSRRIITPHQLAFYANILNAVGIAMLVALAVLFVLGINNIAESVEARE